MSRLRLAGAVGLGGVLVVSGAVGGAWAWMTWKADAVMSAHWDAHASDFPVPFPLSPAELDALRAERLAASPPADPAAPPGDPLAGVDLDALALERAVARGDHLVHAIYICVECHGADMGGGTMIDDPMVGTAKGPNLTLGGVAAAYTASDWDRKVRHGVRPDGRSGLMPSEDFDAMSDRELSDIVAYIRSLPPKDEVVPPVALGPLGTFLVATGQIPMAATRVEDRTEHPVEPPPEGPTVAYGQHLAGICTGCHRSTFQGGPMAGAPPDWLPPANLTPHEHGLKGWTEADFTKLMRTGVRPDGTTVGMPMSLMMKYTPNMKDVEIQALWAYLQQVEPLPDGT